MPVESAVLVERSRLHAIREIGALPFFPALLATAVLVGFRESMTMPYLTLFATEQAHLGPIALGLFLTVRAAGAIAFSILFGAWFDRRPGVAPLIVSLVAGVAGFALLSVTTAFWPLIAVAALPLGMSAAAFPLLFALAKHQSGDHDRMTGERGIAVLRASFSAAWGIGPALGAVAVDRCGYPGLFWISAAFSLFSLLPVGLSGMRSRTAPAAAPAERTGPRRHEPAVLLAAASLALFSMAMGVGAVALPIVVTVDLGGGTGAVGLSYSLCALLEVPVMMAIVLRPAAFLGYRGMALGFAAFSLYFAVVALAPTVPAVVASQVLRALGIGLVSCIGISYLQDLMPGRVGAATALYANTGQLGSLLAGVSAGGWAAAFGYHSLFWACVGLSLGGWVLLGAGRRVRQPG